LQISGWTKLVTGPTLCPAGRKTMADISIGAASVPAITGFPNIQFIAALEDRTATFIDAVPLSTRGGASGNQFRVNAPTDVNPKRLWPGIVECFAGFAIAWIERGPNLGPNVKLRIFDADSFSPGDEMQINPAPVDSNQPPALARLSDGGFIVVWADARADQRIRAQRFDRLGAKVGADFRVDTNAGLHRRPIAAGLANGGFVVGWQARRISQPQQVRFQIFDANAAPVGGEQGLDGGATMAAITALDTGRFVIAHVRNAADGEVLDKTVVAVNVFEPTGAAVGGATEVTNEQAILSDWPTLTPLPGGRFLVAWTQGGTAPATALPNVKARIFSDTQGALGQVSQLNSTTTGLRFSVCAATVAGTGGGGTVYVAWGSRDSGSADNSVFGTAFPIPAAGFP
jgi:hypothetical protein